MTKDKDRDSNNNIELEDEELDEQIAIEAGLEYIEDIEKQLERIANALENICVMVSRIK